MIRTLQSLRFVFVMLVVISHYNDAHFDFGGDCGVSFFFILSGFVLSLAYSDKISEGNFCSWSLLKRQWKKVYPLHIMTFIVMVLFDMRLGYHHSISALIANMLLMQSWSYIYLYLYCCWFCHHTTLKWLLIYFEKNKHLSDWNRAQCHPLASSIICYWQR